MPATKPSLNNELRALKKAARKYDEARDLIADAALVWWGRNGFTRPADVPAAIDRDFVDIIYQCVKAHAATQRALGEEPSLPRALPRSKRARR